MLDAFRARTRPPVRGAILVACALAASASHADAASLVDDLVKTAAFSKADFQGIGDAPMVRELDVPDPSRHAAFAGIVRIRSDGTALVDALAAPERAPLPKGTHSRGRFHDPPKPADVASLEFSDADLEVLADCKTGACKFKLGRTGIESLGAFDWSQPDAGDRFVERFRSEALAYVGRYQKEGNAGLVVYADKSRPDPLGPTVESLVRQFDVFQRQAPGFSNYLLSYPTGAGRVCPTRSCGSWRTSAIDPPW